MVNRHPAPKEDTTMPMRALADDWHALNGEWAPDKDIDCDGLWLALGSTIEVATSVAGEMQKPSPADRDPDWVVGEWELFLERVWQNIHTGVETMVDEGCITKDAADVLLGGFPDAFGEIESTRHAHRELAALRGDYKNWAPGFLLDDDYDPSDNYHFNYPVKHANAQRPEDTPTTTVSSNPSRDAPESEASYRMACVEAESLNEMEVKMNSRLGDDGTPESLTVDRDEDLDVYYACTLVKRVADGMEGE